ncbi:putative Histone-lysine N-methyltransferase ASHH1 [Blattamonas nauphoetae]|uniref:Histone-lysine N-methyltransferase ASHH1 n=1 Tax=Blattamonas nauphoetae TaxID=2049346 RepID=A0ABQ9XXL5_9EUKA|nr:putative Histone-lysine N-methyltransferase ASHH1 [Blattamonas nauphoetae]
MSEPAPSFTPSIYAHLLYKEGSGRPIFYQITAQRCLIGRSSHCQVHISNSTISKIHAVIYYHDSRYFLKDTKSKNGIDINGQEVTMYEFVDENGEVLGNINPLTNQTLDSVAIQACDYGIELHDGDTISFGAYNVVFQTSPVPPSRRVIVIRKPKKETMRIEDDEDTDSIYVEVSENESESSANELNDISQWIVHCHDSEIEKDKTSLSQFQTYKKATKERKGIIRRQLDSEHAKKEKEILKGRISGFMVHPVLQQAVRESNVMEYWRGTSKMARRAELQERWNPAQDLTEEEFAVMYGTKKMGEMAELGECLKTPTGKDRIGVDDPKQFRWQPDPDFALPPLQDTILSITDSLLHATFFDLPDNLHGEMKRIAKTIEIRRGYHVKSLPSPYRKIPVNQYVSRKRRPIIQPPCNCVAKVDEEKAEDEEKKTETAKPNEGEEQTEQPKPADDIVPAKTTPEPTEKTGTDKRHKPRHVDSGKLLNDANSPEPQKAYSINCGPNCVNRSCFVECSQENCPCGAQCRNQRFQRRDMPKLAVTKTAQRGWGLFTEEKLPPHRFVGEYVGEVIDRKTLRKRLQDYDGENNFYFLSLAPNEYIDSSRKGDVTRFLNHSCEPNCITQKWIVEGEMCVGVFVGDHPINAGDELTIDYDWEALDPNARQQCHCGAKNCRGFLQKITSDSVRSENGSPNTAKSSKKPKKKVPPPRPPHRPSSHRPPRRLHSPLLSPSSAISRTTSLLPLHPSPSLRSTD